MNFNSVEGLSNVQISELFSDILEDNSKLSVVHYGCCYCSTGGYRCQYTVFWNYESGICNDGSNYLGRGRSQWWVNEICGTNVFAEKCCTYNERG